MATPLRPVVSVCSAPDRHLIVHCIHLSPLMSQIPPEEVSSALEGLNRYFTLVAETNFGSVARFGTVPKRNPTIPGMLSIHRYLPGKAIVDWFKTVDFDRTDANDFMDLGYEDARNHDCVRANCALNMTNAAFPP